MKYESLIDLVGGLVCFDLPLLVQAFPDRRPAILLQLSRWVTQGKVVSLRRGVYTLADRVRKAPLDPALLAQHLCRPSYLSGLWALGFHDMIPERVVVHTSVTPRLPTRFDNAGVTVHVSVEVQWFGPAGQTATVKSGITQLKIHCVEIRERSAIVTINGQPEKRVLQLASGI